MTIRIGWRVSAALATPLLLVEPALAHHAMGNRTPATFFEGFLSGLAHPVIGIDHFAVMIAVGLVVAACGLNLLLPVAFVLASALGVALHVQGFGLPAAELAVAASVVLLGLLVARGTALAPYGWAALLVVAGLLHGYAYGESIAGAEPAPFWAYLFGLVAVQSAIVLAVGFIAHRPGMPVMAARIAGATIAAVGLAVMVQQMLS
jgi:urease accessory protein